MFSFGENNSGILPYSSSIKRNLVFEHYPPFLIPPPFRPPECFTDSLNQKDPLQPCLMIVCIVNAYMYVFVYEYCMSMSICI